MTAKHTPDEWEYSGNTEVIGIRRVQTLEPICSIKPANYTHAALIAAAPELLAILERAADYMGEMGRPEDLLSDARTIIRKARGE